MQSILRGARYHYFVTIDLLSFESDALATHDVVVGVDEVGRGALAGPLVVCAVAVRTLAPPPTGLTDSKLVRAQQREELVVPLREWASAYGLGWATAVEIDAWGLRVALAVAATRAIDALAMKVDFALLDGTFNLLSAPNAFTFDGPPVPDLPYANLPHACLVKGDQRSATIAAASVLAKVARDAYMVEVDGEHPDYGWTGNKGYGAAEHLAALRRLGPTPLHRTSWRLPAHEGSLCES